MSVRFDRLICMDVCISVRRVKQKEKEKREEEERERERKMDAFMDFIKSMINVI